jgi:hypothetical protein
MTEPISSRKQGGTGCLILFFAVFLSMGAAFLWLATIRPLLSIVTATSWRAVPCTIVSSAVKTHNSSDGDTYSIAVNYRYEVDGQQFHSERYSFISGSSSGYKSKQAVVARLPPGTQSTCYVNPTDPRSAVLERGWNNELWIGLLPLLFVFVGGGGIYLVLRHRAKERQMTAAGTNDSIASTPQLGEGESGEAVLKSKTGRIAKVVGFFFFAAFWNGVVSIFIFAVLIPSFHKGKPEWLLFFFLIPFELIGLVMIGAFIKALIGLSTPVPRLTVNRRALRPGERAQISWELSGRVDRITTLKLALEGREEATYRRGTTTHTDRRLFSRTEIAVVDSSQDLRAGQAVVHVPEDAMHSFAAPNNKIVWELVMKGDIPGRPDLDEVYPFTVLPHKIEGQRT